MRRRVRPLAPWMILVGSWAAEVPAQEFEVRAEVTEVEFGQPFALTVVREWARDAEPPPFDTGLLEPLVLQPVRRLLEDDQAQVRETLHYMARAFLLEDFQWEGIDLTLRVLPALDRNAPGPVEPPGPLLEIPGGVPKWVPLLGVLLFLAAVGLGFRVLRTREQPAGQTDGILSPWDVARQQLDALRAEAKDVPDDLRPSGDRLSATVRQLLADGLGIPAWERTTTEILGHPDLATRCAASPRQVLEDLLTRCDRLRFSAPPGGWEDWNGALDGMAAFLLEARDTGAEDRA